jgi:hypothetical protein
MVPLEAVSGQKDPTTGAVSGLMSNISVEYLIASCALDCSRQLESDGKKGKVGS